MQVIHVALFQEQRRKVAEQKAASFSESRHVDSHLPGALLRACLPGEQDPDPKPPRTRGFLSVNGISWPWTGDLQA